MGETPVHPDPALGVSCSRTGVGSVNAQIRHSLRDVPCCRDFRRWNCRRIFLIPSLRTRYCGIRRDAGCDLAISGGHYSSRWLERQQRIFDNCQHDSIRGVPEHSQRPPEAAKSFRYSSGKPPSTKERLRAQLAAKCTNTAWRTSASLLPEF